MGLLKVFKFLLFYFLHREQHSFEILTDRIRDKVCSAFPTRTSCSCAVHTRQPDYKGTSVWPNPAQIYTQGLRAWAVPETLKNSEWFGKSFPGLSEFICRKGKWAQSLSKGTEL